jgi:hypothetical protein
MSRRYEITTLPQLVNAMRGGALLKKTLTRGAAAYEVGLKACHPQAIREALADGWLAPLDPGLFGDIRDAQTFSLNRTWK